VDAPGKQYATPHGSGVASESGMSARIEGFDHRRSQKLDFPLNAVLSRPMPSVSNMESAFGAPGRHFTDRTVQIDI
jgi:hypothetical protein